MFPKLDSIGYGIQSYYIFLRLYRNWLHQQEHTKWNIMCCLVCCSVYLPHPFLVLAFILFTSAWRPHLALAPSLFHPRRETSSSLNHLGWEAESTQLVQTREKEQRVLVRPFYVEIEVLSMHWNLQNKCKCPSPKYHKSSLLYFPKKPSTNECVKMLIK